MEDQNVKNESINLKLILKYILPITVIGMLLINIIAYSAVSSNANKLESKVNENIGNIISVQVEKINQTLLDQSDLVKYLSDAAAYYAGTGDQTGMLNMLKNFLQNSTYPAYDGVYYEPYTFSDKLQWWGPYAYRNDDGSIAYTLEMNDMGDYRTNTWYQLGKNANGPVFTEPYLEPITDTIMVTGVGPVYKDGVFKGVVSGDIGLKDIQKLILGTKYGYQSDSYLVSSKGSYMANSDKKKVPDKNIKDDYKNITPIFEKDKGFFNVNINGESTRVFYDTVPSTGWKIVTMIPANEIPAANSNAMLLLVLIDLIVIALIVLAAVKISRTDHEEVIKNG